MLWPEIAYSRPLWSVLKVEWYFPPNDSTDEHHSNTENFRPYAEKRRLSYKVWSGTTRVHDREKRTGQDNQKVTKDLYVTNLGEPTIVPTETKIFMAGNLNVCKVSIRNFQGL